MRLDEIFSREKPSGEAVNLVRGFSGGGTMKGNRYSFTAPEREVVLMMDRYFSKTGDNSWVSNDGWNMTLAPGKHTIAFRRS